ncbi:MAG TPA: M1 family aminopeptidase [Thermoanaerobaculia bacterium]|nr:M1 family aminopeptidase [Thermoanaerobaculia bacterium]
MRRSALPFAIFVCLIVSTIASAATDPTYAALRAIRPDGRTIALHNFVYERDVFRFTLSGTLHLLTPVEGKTEGAVFIGQGSYELTPATTLEKRQLAINANDDKLQSIADQFDSAVFLGAALPAAAIKMSAPVSGPADAKAVDRWESYLKKQRKDLRTNLHIRLLQEVVDGEIEPLFLGWVDGRKHPPAVLIVDMRGNLGDEQSAMFVSHETKGGAWYSSRLLSELKTGRGMTAKPLADAEHYFIDSHIEGAKLSATSVMTFTAGRSFRVLPINLTPDLRVREAAFAPASEKPVWTPVAFIQEDKKQDGDAAVVFPTALAAGQKYMLKMTYDGKEVLSNAGDGNFTITRRSSWYPNVGSFDDVATYELRFTTPQKFQIVSVGDEVENRVDGDSRIALWKSPRPIRVAGFNYGKFKKLSQSDKESGMSFDVYTNPGTPDSLREINEVLAYIAATEGGPSNLTVNTASLAQAAMADGINTARTGQAFFGPLADKRISITQQSQWFFGQSWPTLIYLPYVAFLNGTQRNTLQMNDAKDFIDNVGAHEVAHQWWGHQIGTKTYRDEWISEGFSEFTAALVAQQTGGWNRYNDFWEKSRRTILERPRGASVSNNDAGPIVQGARLSTWRNRVAYSAVVYSKGAYVLHMLRMAMFDTRKGDAAFMAMMTDFAKTYAGRNASTADFQSIVEKHAPPQVKLTKDGKMDWFFGQWVYGTGIPKYTSKLDYQDLGGGRYKVTGTVTQAEVPADFAVTMPVYVHFDKTSYAKVASTVLVGNVTKPVEFEIALPQKPQKFAINSLHDVLAR